MQLWSIYIPLGKIHQIRVFFRHVRGNKFLVVGASARAGILINLVSIKAIPILFLETFNPPTL